MTLSDLAKEAASREGITQVKALRILRGCFDQISTAVAGGERVNIQSFGSFSPRVTPAREMRNPRTGVPVDVPAKTRLAFKPSGKTVVAD